MAKRRAYGSGSIQQRSATSFRVRAYVARDAATGATRRYDETVKGTRKEAERRLRELQSQADHGIDLPPDRVTLADWLPRWLEAHTARRGLAERTELRYRHIVEAQLLPPLGHVRLQALRADHIAAVYARQLESLSPNTIRQHHVVMKKALDDAVRSNLIAKNPADAVDPPRVSRDTEQRALTGEEIAALLSVARGTPFEAPIQIALATGLREGELIALTWQDFDGTAGVLNVSHGAGFLPGKGMKVTSTKTKNARRAVELSAATQTALRRHRQAQLERRLQLGAVWHDNDLIFPSSVGSLWNVRNFYRGYKKVVARSGIGSPETLDFHCLRHTAATQWLRAGADIHSVSRRLGHASAAFSMDKYAHLLSGMQRTAAEALDHLLA